ncbi:THAP domain-containing protein 6-like [Anoplophora glabripennis]|uniref:THAP domain-containing protein 6-like n=1 Tax=Anoplophora glabripennis TaxID=217634 RepID=UPI000C768030|nr:THAP domain-containing protein 6-like [Anoplophora glabripennis]
MPKRKHVKKCCFLCDENCRLENVSFEVTYHRFPSVVQIKKLWMDFCNLDEEKDDVSNIYICSLHFQDEDYTDLNAKKFGGRLRLKKGVVPSILVPHGKRKMFLSVAEEPPLVSSPPSSQILEPVPSTSKITSLTPLDYSISGSPNSLIQEITTSTDDAMGVMTTPKHSKKKSPDVSTPRRAKRKLLFALDEVERQRKKNRIINQRNRRLTKRVKSLQDLVKHLRNKALISEEASLVMVNR